MNISSSHVQNTFFLWTLWYGNWTRGIKFPSTEGGSVNYIQHHPIHIGAFQTAVRMGWCCMWIDWTTRGRGKFNAPCPVAASQCPEKEGILDMARGNVHFQQHAWGYFAFKRLLRCSDDRSLPLLKKNLRFDGFSGCKPLSSRRGQTACCFSMLPLLRTMKRVTEVTEVKQQQPKNSTKSMNSHQKSQEYIKGKTSLFIL